jgi:hypothetical protein
VKPRWSKALSPEELDEFRLHMEAALEDDPSSRTEEMALRLLTENEELRDLLRTNTVAELPQVVVAQAEKIESLESEIASLKDELADKEKKLQRAVADLIVKRDLISKIGEVARCIGGLTDVIGVDSEASATSLAFTSPVETEEDLEEVAASAVRAKPRSKKGM